MGHFDRKESVEQYMSMLDGSDGRDMIDRMREFLDSDSGVLELGMGPGRSLENPSQTRR